MKVSFPGLVDLQVNGFAGVDFNSPACAGKPMARALAAMRDTGVTRCLPTVITSSTEHFAACAQAILQDPQVGIAGLHMEGPYISPVDGPRGAHPLEYVRPASIDGVKRLEELGVTDVIVGFRYPYTTAPDTQPLTEKIDLLRKFSDRVITQL